jgi:hypothetical protein
MKMRHVIALVFAISVLAAVPAAAGTHEFSAWAAERSSELDRQWDRVSTRWSPSTSSPDGTMTDGRGIRARIRTRAGEGRAGASTLPAPGLGPGWTHSNLQFTTYNDGLLWLNSTRKRTGPGRGVSTLSSPAAATRGHLAAGRTPFNRNAKYTRTIYTKGRNTGDRLAAPLHNRITRRNVTRTPSTLHGASRMRRQPSRGRW